MTRTDNGAFNLIIYKDKILLFLRDNIPTIPYPNHWHLPGGRIEKGETPLMAVKRELTEEVTYIPKNLEYLGEERESDGSAYLYVSFVSDDEAKEFKLGPGEGQEIKFFSLEEISQLKLTPILEYYFKKYKKEIMDSIKTKKLPKITTLDVVPDPLHDQFFLLDDEILQKIVSFADLTKEDTVLEVGAGTGNLTFKLAQKAGRVISFEIDKKFKPYFANAPKNIEMHFEDAWDYVQLHGKFVKKKEYNKVVSNIPYSFIEPLLHNLTFLTYDKVILLVPKRTLKTLSTSGVFTSFFIFKILLEVPKENFNPVPRTNSVVIELVKLPNPVETKNLALFLRQYIYQHEGQLVKNSLMEGLIRYERLVNKKVMTKNEARQIVAQKGFDKKDLEDTPGTNKLYADISEKFN